MDHTKEYIIDRNVKVQIGDKHFNIISGNKTESFLYEEIQKIIFSEPTISVVNYFFIFIFSFLGSHFSGQEYELKNRIILFKKKSYKEIIFILKDSFSKKNVTEVIEDIRKKISN